MRTIAVLLLLSACARIPRTPPELCQDSCGIHSLGKFTPGTPDHCRCQDVSWCGGLCADHGGEAAASFPSQGHDTCRCWDSAFFIGAER